MKITSKAYLGGAVLAAFFVACGSSSNGIAGKSPAEDDTDASDGSSSGGDDDSGTSHPFKNDGGDDTGPSGCSVCSADLHSVLACNTHQVITTCPANSGCGTNGQCISPCDAATANGSTIGCEYYSVESDILHDIIQDATGGCFAAFIANTWTAPVTVTAEFNGSPLDVSHSVYLPQGSGSSLTYMQLAKGTIPANGFAIVFLSDTKRLGTVAPPCPTGVTAATMTDGAVHGTGLGHAFHLMTSAPVVAYDVYPYGGAPAATASATLLLPVSAWDKNYVTTYMYDSQPMTPGLGNIAFVASQDNTTITINPTSAIAGGTGVATTASGTSKAYTLNKGGILQFEQNDDLTGSVVAADKPIGTWGGHSCMFIPASLGGCDGAHQQIPPVKALGSEYVAVRYKNRGVSGLAIPSVGNDENVPWRLVGAVDGTTLTYQPSAPSGAPTTLKKGQLVEFNSPGPFVVSSQDATHPFYFAAHMTGANGQDGDPETVNVVPPKQYMNDYIFFTDPTYSNTNLVVVRKAGGADVTLECLKQPLSGWQKVGSYEYTRVDVQSMGAPVGDCANGRHEMKSTDAFGLTVWGWDKAVSYAYPAGASIKPVNTVVIEPPPPPR